MEQLMEDQNNHVNDNSQQSSPTMDIPKIFTERMSTPEMLMSMEENKYLNDLISDSDEEYLYFREEPDMNLQELLLFKEKFVPIDINIPTKFSPNIPNYLPWPGEIGPLFWIPRVDGVVDNIGLSVLDEPSLQQTDPAILNLTLCRNSKDIGIKSDNFIKSVEPTTKDINFWISKIEGIRSSLPSKEFYCPKKLPDMNELMKEWPTEMEELMAQISLPSSSLMCDLKSFINIICNICEIPVYDYQCIYSVHKLFALYLEFAESQHFGKE